MPEDLATLESARVATTLRRRSRVDGERDREGEEETQDSRRKLFCTSFDSRIGRIYVASTERGVCKISVPRESRKDFFEWLKEHCDVESVIDNRARNKEVIVQLPRYFNGKLAKFTCSVALIGTPSQIRIWKELSKIPYGSTITYKPLAKRVSARS